ncbi:MAG: hypothetical protein ABI995_07195 [Acidobacteriota bacterium]
MRMHVERIRKALVTASPAELTAQLASHMQGMEQAASLLRLVQAEEGESGTALTGGEKDRFRVEMGALRDELAGLKALSHTGEEFWLGWARLWGMDSGYTNGGVPAELLTGEMQCHGSLTVKG